MWEGVGVGGGHQLKLGGVVAHSIDMICRRLKLWWVGSDSIKISLPTMKIIITLPVKNSFFTWKEIKRLWRGKRFVVRTIGGGQKRFLPVRKSEILTKITVTPTLGFRAKKNTATRYTKDSGKTINKVQWCTYVKSSIYFVTIIDWKNIMIVLFCSKKGLIF